MKLFVMNMNRDEAKKVFDANEKIRQQMYDWNYESEMDYAHDIIYCFDRSAIDYCIGYDRGTYFRCRDEDKFIEGCQNMQKSYGFLPFEDNLYIEETARLLAILRELENIDISETVYEELEDEVIKRCNAIADNIDCRLTDLFKCALFEEDYALETWLECGCDMYSDCYIIEEENSYILYRDKTESFN